MALVAQGDSGIDQRLTRSAFLVVAALIAVSAGRA
jgi:hypothetical protein